MSFVVIIVIVSRPTGFDRGCSTNTVVLHKFFKGLSYKNFTEPAPRPVQSVGRNIRPYVCVFVCLSPPLAVFFAVPWILNSLAVAVAVALAP